MSPPDVARAHAHPTPPNGRQLPLPLPPPDPSPPALPQPLRTVPARRVWAGLTEGARVGVHLTLLRIAREVLDEPEPDRP
jgi:hypothetical protein